MCVLRAVPAICPAVATRAQDEESPLTSVKGGNADEVSTGRIGVLGKRAMDKPSM